MQNLLRITFIPLEIGNNVPIVFQILCRSMALPFELPAVPPRSPLITLDIQIAVSSAVISSWVCGPKSRQINTSWNRQCFAAHCAGVKIWEFGPVLLATVYKISGEPPCKIAGQKDAV